MSRSCGTFRHLRFTSFRTQSCLDCSQQRLLAKGLEQVIDRAAAHGSRPQFLISMCGDEDDRHLRMAGHQTALQLEPAHSGHAHVEDQAVRLAHAIRPQELLGRSKYVHYESDGPEQPPNALTHGATVAHALHFTSLPHPPS